MLKRPVEIDEAINEANNEAQCKGCGTCVAACPCGAISQNHFRERQIFAMINVAIPANVK